MLARVLEGFGVVPREIGKRTFQFTMEGEIPDEMAAIVNASILLASRHTPGFVSGAFASTHDGLTGKKMMVYGAGVKDDGYPYSDPAATNRTDIQGRTVDMDADLFQILETLAVDATFGGPFADIMTEFYIPRFLSILERHGLIGVLRQATWIYDKSGAHDDLPEYEAMLRRFTDAWATAVKLEGFGIIKEVNNLIQAAAQRMRERRESVIAEDPSEYKRMLRW
ncbi:MAG: hypothetical protein UY05_C0012G0015 [Candidatus Peregrinibacteria bacterium GW2011_GWA2_47_7]|nr:MAG: hypothetical protein UY05_C0012G0015 [Candidatus Peregrinibacteria bacterium GW2011_GWA2_47_7]